MDKLTELMQQAQTLLTASKSLVELDEIRVHYLGKKGFDNGSTEAAGPAAGRRAP